MKKLLLVDATGYLFRAFFASRDFRSNDGHPTGALLFLVNMLRKLRAEAGADYEACIMDAPGGTFRNELSADYKKNRKEIDPDLVAQIAPAKEFIQAMGCPLICHPGVEADDVIATLVRQGVAAGMQVTIATGDKDLMQIVDSNVKIYDGMKGKIFDEKAVLEKFGVQTKQISDYLAICGDSSDNIKGVRKVGPKTAVKFLREYGDLNNIVANVEQISGAVGKNFKEAIANGELELARQLTQLKDDVDLGLNVNELKIKSPDIATWQKLCNKFQFKKLADTFSKGAAAPTPKAAVVDSVKSAPAKAAPVNPIRSKFVTIDTAEELQRHVSLALKTDLVAIDTETVGAPVTQAKMVGFSLCYEPSTAYYVPLSHYDITATQIPQDKALEIIRPLLESDVRKVFHNGKYDLHVFANYGLRLGGIIDDTKIAVAVMEPAQPNHLSDLSEFYLNIKATSFGDVVDRRAGKDFGDVDVKTATDYSAEDSEVTYKLDPLVIGALEGKVKKLYEVIDRPLMGVLFSMERHGVCLDRDKLDSLSEEWQTKIQTLEAEAFKVAGERFNLNSPQQVSAILFDKFKAPVIKKTNTGANSTDDETLQALADEHPLAKILLEHRGLAKLKGTYSDGLLKMIHPETGRVHTDFNQTYVNTGRLSSSRPNLQNIPIRTPDGRRIREAFAAGPGNTIIAADYSQIELRLMAHISGDETLLRSFNSGADVHVITAAEVFGVPEDKVTDDLRRSAKAINFGLIYGMTSYGLSKALNISVKEAGKYIELYFSRYPGVAAYMKGVPQLVQRGYMTTIIGRKLAINNSPGALRAAINAPMQGSAADIVKLAMIKVDSWLREEKLATKMILQVHDELVFESPDSEKELLMQKLPEIMENVVKLKIPLEVSLGSGANWGIAH